MGDSENTVIITGIPEHVEGKEFIDFVGKAGEIMTGRQTGQRMAEMKPTTDTTGRMLREGIVTYNDGNIAAKALALLNGQKLQGSTIQVRRAGEIYNYISKDQHDCQKDLNMKDPRCRDYNNAWRYFWKKNQVCNGESDHTRVIYETKGGRGGRGMGPGHDGEDGQPGEDGRNGGRGGQGGKAGKAGFLSRFFATSAPPQPPHDPQQGNHPPKGSQSPPLD